MSIDKGPTEGGSGGKRGHSNMEHWNKTEQIKESSKMNRRNKAKKEIILGKEEAIYDLNLIKN